MESAFQDKPALAMGEVIGANIFDLLLVVGIMGLLWIVPLMVKSRNIGRLFGIVLTLLYVAYMVFTVIRG